MAEVSGPQQGVGEAARLRQLIMGFRTTQTIYVAACLGLADHLAKKRMTADELATHVSAEPRTVYRLLRALASLGVFSEGDDGLFEMTPAAELLRRDGPGSLRSIAMFYGDEIVWRAYGNLKDAVTTGKTAFLNTYDLPFYDYLERHPRPAALFHEMMTGFSALEAEAILAAYDFSAARLIVDVGGGQGRLMAAVLGQYRGSQAIVFDASGPTDDTQHRFSQAGIAGRIQFTQGDFFKFVPVGGDLYMLKSIIHNWNSSSATVILRNCARAMLPDGRILVAERLIPSGNVASEAKLFDINMMVTAGGEERTEAEYASLFRAAGLGLTRIFPTSSYMSLIEAKKV